MTTTNYLGATLLRLAVAAPVTRFLVSRDKSNSNKKPFYKRFFLHLAILIVIVGFSQPFLSRSPNFFDHFNAVVSADKSTVYQQYRRAQTWIKEQVDEGKMDPEEGAAKKAENEKKHSFIHDSGRKQIYIKFGDMPDFTADDYEEPSFLSATAFAATFALWIMSAVMLLCYYLPAGGLLSIFLVLCVLFSIELEARFIDSDSLFEYIPFVDKNEWTVFEVIKAVKQSVVALVCLVIIIAGLFSDDSASKTRSHARNLLRTNAAIVTVLKDENLKEAQVEPDEPIGSKGGDVATFIARGIGLLVLVGSLFFKID